MQKRLLSLHSGVSSGDSATRNKLSPERNSAAAVDKKTRTPQFVWDIDGRKIPYAEWSAAEQRARGEKGSHFHHTANTSTGGAVELLTKTGVLFPEPKNPATQPTPTIPAYPGERTEADTERWIENHRSKVFEYREQQRNVYKIGHSTYGGPRTPFHSGYQNLRPRDFVVSVEHCHMCACHNMALKHDEAEYVKRADAVLRVCAEWAYRNPINARVGVSRFPAQVGGVAPAGGAASRLGAFEVQVCFRDAKGDYHIELLHSKLASMYWPSHKGLLSRLTSFVRQQQGQKNGLVELFRPSIRRMELSNISRALCLPVDRGLFSNDASACPLEPIVLEAMPLSHPRWPYPKLESTSDRNHFPLQSLTMDTWRRAAMVYVRAHDKRRPLPPKPSFDSAWDFMVRHIEQASADTNVAKRECNSAYPVHQIRWAYNYTGTTVAQCRPCPWGHNLTPINHGVDLCVICAHRRESPEGYIAVVRCEECTSLRETDFFACGECMQLPYTSTKWPGMPFGTECMADLPKESDVNKSEEERQRESQREIEEGVELVTLEESGPSESSLDAWVHGASSAIALLQTEECVHDLTILKHNPSAPGHLGTLFTAALLLARDIFKHCRPEGVSAQDPGGERDAAAAWRSAQNLLLVNVREWVAFQRSLLTMITASDDDSSTVLALTANFREVRHLLLEDDDVCSEQYGGVGLILLNLLVSLCRVFDLEAPRRVAEAEQKEAELNGELSQAQSAMEVVSSKRRAQLQTEDKSPEATKRLEELGEDERQKKHAVEQVQSRLDATTAALRAWREAAASGRA
jgi:hypothetical protein